MIHITTYVRNKKHLFPTTRNAQNVARVKAALSRNLNCQFPQDSCWMPTSNIEKDGQAIQDLQACIVEFNVDPFDLTKPAFSQLQSALFETPELVIDFQMALQNGKIETDAISHERVFTKHGSLKSTIHRYKRHNLVNKHFVFHLHLWMYL